MGETLNEPGLNEWLESARKLIEGAGESSGFVEAKTSFFGTEYHWRRDASGLLKWIGGDAPSLKDAIKEVNECVSRYEASDLSRVLTDTNSDLEPLRAALELVKPDGGSPREQAKRVRDALEKLSKDYTTRHADSSSTIQLHKKWPIVTAFLALMNPEQHIFIRPTVVQSSVLEAVFKGTEYKVGASPDVYEGYVEAAERLKKEMEAKLTPSPRSLSWVSMWWTAYCGLRNKQRAVSKSDHLLKSGHHLILQGPPGTGKTYLAERSLTDGSKRVVDLARFDTNAPTNVEVVRQLVQFHASYDYEDFVRGFRPTVSDENGSMGFELRDGPFAQMVSFAMKHPDIQFLLIVDEINRADLARVLGECIYLLDRRCVHVQKSMHVATLESVWSGESAGAVATRYSPNGSNPAGDTDYTSYSGSSAPLTRLCMPDNFHLVGTMNTADRSISRVDIALRRRFTFMPIEPNVDVIKKSRWYIEGQDTRSTWKKIAGWMELLNGGADDDATEGLINEPGYHLGHAYFMADDIESLRNKIIYQVLPLLSEYVSEGILVRSDESANLLDEMRGFGTGS